MDLAWITFVFLPLASMLTLAFSIGVLVFLLHVLLRDSKSLKKIETNDREIVGDGKKVRGFRTLILKPKFIFPLRNKGKALQAAEAGARIQNIEVLTSEVSSEKESVIKENPSILESSVSSDSQLPLKTSEFSDNGSEADKSKSAEIKKPPNVTNKNLEIPKQDEKYNPETPNNSSQLKAKPVEDLSEVELLLRRKSTSPPIKTATSSNEQISPASTKSKVYDSDDVSMLLGGSKATEEGDRETINIPERLVSDFKASKGEAKDLEVNPATMQNLEKPIKVQYGQPKEGKDLEDVPTEDKEVESLLRFEEAADKVEDIQDQFVKLKDSLVQLKKTLKKFENKPSVEKSQ